jgi:hypothetical protein
MLTTDEPVLGPSRSPVEAPILQGAVAGSDALPSSHAALDGLGELALLLRGEQCHRSDLIEVLTD